MNSHSLARFALAALLRLLANAYDLDHFVAVQFFEAGGSQHVLLVLLGEQEAGLLQSLAVEAAGVLEDLAQGVNADVLREDLLALSLDGLDVVPVGKL